MGLVDILFGDDFGDWQCIVIEGSCLDVLQQLPNEFIDLTVIDPPYESLSRHRARGTTTRLKNSKASSNAWFKTFPNTSYWTLFKMLKLVHKKNTHCYVFCDSETEHVILSGVNPYDDKLNTALQVYRDDRTVTCLHGAPSVEFGRAWPPLTWVKTKEKARATGGGTLCNNDVRTGMGYHWRRAEERILFLEKGKRKLNNLGWANVLVGPRAGKSDYPTAKPRYLIKKLIENSSQPGDIVLDCFAGSGVTGRAAISCGRRAILIDIDTTWMQEHPPVAGTIFIREG